jgi:mannan endo-1,4-beta-mannosidase
MSDPTSRRGRRRPLTARPQPAGRRRLPGDEPGPGLLAWARRRWLILALAVVVLVVAVAGGLAATQDHHHHGLTPAAEPHQAALPRMPAAYLGVFTPPAPASYAGVRKFAATTGVNPGLVTYYSGWGEPFQTRFATAVVHHDAVPLVQIDPTNISLAQIAAGQYDSFLRTYAQAVHQFGARVVLSFGHEMNGSWYSWGHKHTSPKVFVAAWRHIVTVFRTAGAANVTWLWTINVIGEHAHVPAPGPWWPGSKFVNWVGIDGYYQKPSWRFAPLFGPTIKAVRKLTIDPIIISETSVAEEASRPAQIADLFAGVRAYGLLGLIWFDVNRNHNWQLTGPASIAAFRRGAHSYTSPAS